MPAFIQSMNKGVYFLPQQEGKNIDGYLKPASDFYMVQIMCDELGWRFLSVSITKELRI